MNKRRLAVCLLTMIMVLGMTNTAFADVAWDPNNSFYEQHRDECIYEDRTYQANGTEGFVTLWNAPNGSYVEEQYENGTHLQVYWIWRDWGCVSIWERGKETSGWVNMSDLALVYDYISFKEEYADRITDYDGEFADYAGNDAVLNFYEYPGAPEVKESRSTDNEYGDIGYLTGRKDGNSYIQSIFVDENGMTWGFVGYMFGQVNGWFCLDDPDREDFPAREVDEGNLIPPAKPEMPVRGLVTSILPWVLVLSAVSVTGVMLMFLRKRKR